MELVISIERQKNCHDTSASAVRALPGWAVQGRMFSNAGAARAHGLTLQVSCYWLLLVLLLPVRSLAATLAWPLGEAAESLELARPLELRFDRSCLFIAAWRLAHI